ncbi:MAG: hypothetical protein WD491_07200 [Balneolales bacterium]
MKKTSELRNTADNIGDFASAMGRGLVAGLAGTIAMTIVQMIEMKIMNRPGSTVPADGLEKMLPVKAPEDEKEKMKLAQMVHFAYGTTWGIPLAVMDQAGIARTLASISHFGAVWGTALIMLPKQNLAPPISEWDSQTLLLDAIHHAVYATAAGFTYHAISRKTTYTMPQQISKKAFSSTLFNMLGLLTLKEMQKPKKGVDVKKMAKKYRKEYIKPQSKKLEKKIAELTH